MIDVLIIGAGRFGRYSAKQLHDLGHQVMIVDRNEEKINENKIINIKGINTNNNIFVPKRVNFQLDNKFENNNNKISILNNYDKNSIINNRQKKINEIKNFLNKSNWKIENEFINRNIFNAIRKNNFINDIKSFINKREVFKQGITKLK